MFFLYIEVDASFTCRAIGARSRYQAQNIWCRILHFSQRKPGRAISMFLPNDSVQPAVDSMRLVKSCCHLQCNRYLDRIYRCGLLHFFSLHTKSALYSKLEAKVFRPPSQARSAYFSLGGAVLYTCVVSRGRSIREAFPCRLVTDRFKRVGWFRKGGFPAELCVRHDAKRLCQRDLVVPAF